jgi:hypothetical protein
MFRITAATEGKFLLGESDEKLQIPHRGEGVSRGYTGNTLRRPRGAPRRAAALRAGPRP